ncbi:MAG: hypothetical protein RL481_926 [Pseudomonadota bacterium]|jgi:hypothetical protein
MRKFALLLGAAIVGISSPVAAAPIFNTSNGHYYEFVAGQVSWQTALQNAANAAPLVGYSSYLATVTSEAESDFIFNNVSSGGNWFAGTDEETEGVFKWVAGPEAGQIFFGPGAGAAYNRFSPGEPNNCCGGEDYLHSFAGSQAWNDLQANNLGFISGYVVEYSRLGVVPEPASWALMIAGFGLVGGAMRRRQKISVAYA